MLSGGTPPEVPGHLYEASRDEVLSAGLHRVEATQLEGPLRAPMGRYEVELGRLKQTLRQIDMELKDVQEPENAEILKRDLHEQLGKITYEAFSQFTLNDFDAECFGGLVDAWLSLLAECDPEDHAWAECVFFDWGERILPDLLAGLEDGEAEPLIEECYTECVTSLPRFELQQQHRELALRREWILKRVAQTFEHREVRYGSANDREGRASAQAVPNLFNKQSVWLDSLRQLKWHYSRSMWSAQMAYAELPPMLSDLAPFQWPAQEW